MNGEAGRIVLDEGLNVLSARCGQHFRSGNRHVLSKGALVVTPSSVDFQHGDAPCVHFLLLDLDEIIVIRQALAKTVKTHHPRTGAADRALEFRAKAGDVGPTSPILSRCASLKSIPTQEIRLLLLHVAETRDIDAIGAITQGHAVLVAGNDSAAAAAHAVVHEVVPQLAA